MGIKIVKPTEPAEGDKDKKPADEAQMLRAVQSWVNEFRSSKETNRRPNLWQSQKS